jgi:hypothetical protein
MSAVSATGSRQLRKFFTIVDRHRSVRMARACPAAEIALTAAVVTSHFVLWSARLFCAFAALFVSAITLGGCSDDDDDEQTPAEACNQACGAQVAGCVPTAAGVQGCSVACQFGFAVTACRASYQTALNCVGARPFLTCTNQSITVSVATAECADELAAYLTCAAGSLVPACLDAPLGDAQCQATAGMPPRAKVCLGEMPAGCKLFEGTARAGGVGSFCCP